MAGTDAAAAASPTVDPATGYCAATKTYYSLRPAAPLPPPTLPLSVTDYAFSLLPSPLPSHPALISTSAPSSSISFPSLISLTHSLSSSLHSRLHLARGDAAFILAPSDLHIPVLYFALLRLGIVVSPANPASTPAEIAHQCALTRPSIAFSTAASAHKLPQTIQTIIIDSPGFLSLMSSQEGEQAEALPQGPKQSDPAAVLFSSGTTGRVKGVVLTHRNFTALVAGYHAARTERETPGVALFTVPLFHVFGFFMLIRAAALGETVVMMGRFDMGTMLKAIEEYRVTNMPVSPPLVVAMAKLEEAGRFDLSSLEVVGCGGAPLRREMAERFVKRFPHVKIIQGYGMTESAGSVSVASSDEPAVYGSVGLLAMYMEAKIVDTNSGECLPPGQPGELWLKGPTIMSGYIGDDEATASTLDSEGWLKTGDLCYFNHEGHLFIEDRLKELIKYKAYQVPPAELESILQSHPEIADAAVVPYPDEAAGQIPMAFIVKQPNSNLNGEEVINFVAKQVAPYKKVRRVVFVSSIPKSAAGKILRRELINQAVSRPTSKL